MRDVDRLRNLDTGAISDALDKLGLEGVVTGIRSMPRSDRIAGRVVTVKLVAAAGRKSERHLATAAIEASGPEDVLVVEHHSRSDCAGWGGILSRAAKARGIAGTIVDGAVRDVDESREIGYAVFARDAVPRTARGRIVEESWNAPIRIGSVEVNPGDLVLADGSGIAFLPKDRAGEILDEAESIARREQAMADAVGRGERVSQVMGGEYEKMVGDENG